MNWLDYLLILLFIYYLYRGSRLGLLKQVIGLVIFFVAFYVALALNEQIYNLMETYLHVDEIISSLAENGDTPVWLVHVILKIIAFLLVFALVTYLLSFLTGRLKVIKRIPVVGLLNILAGGLLGAIKGALIVFMSVGLLSLLKTDFWVRSLEASAVVALSHHYMAVVFQFIINSIIDSLGILV